MSGLRAGDGDQVDPEHPPADEPPTTPPPGLPAEVAWVRTTPAFTAATVPDGLLRSHRLADGVWGVLRVQRGSVGFATEADGAGRRLGPAGHVIIEPGVAHRIDPAPDARFVIDFYR
ncbi:MAG: DUF1971 domain-containing protein [Acidimicrobiales bacterium]